ncbi:ATP-dependent helicase rhp16-like [Nicotiana tabacum]|uniref:ATP-dependent helicase rhp16-like n=1 Tax=Nicotiana tabacum TaxID=4097 RepID=A0AC58S3Z5_TOBAC
MANREGEEPHANVKADEPELPERWVHVEQSCSLCKDTVEDPIVTSCTHVFCKTCLINFAESRGKLACPSCDKPLTFDSNANNDKGDSSSKPTVKGFRSSSILNKIQLDEFQTSTKIEALREEIRLVERDGSAKGIVFSQFTSFWI